MTILITGASGFIGKALAQSLTVRGHNVVCMSRRSPNLSLPFVQGDFAAFEDLHQLDAWQFDAIIHLGAVTGGCLEREGILVNVEGTRALMQYLLGRGCQKFVLASSIAAIGIHDANARPLTLPIPDEHPCLDTKGYGLSKTLMEEVARYLHRQHPQGAIHCLRLAAVCPDDAPPPLFSSTEPVGEWALAQLTMLTLTDAVDVFTRSVEALDTPEFTIMNAIAPISWTGIPTSELLRGWWGESAPAFPHDIANPFASAYQFERIQARLGFTAPHTMITHQKLLESVK
jgi:nucleoside-diphosphate-sugar epimerase